MKKLPEKSRRQLALPGPEKPPPGKRGKKRHPKAVGGDAVHQWGKAPGRSNQPSWLNDAAEGRQTCRICGVERKLAGKSGLSGNINADHAGFGEEGRQLLEGKDVAKVYDYVDAKGRTFQTMIELGCPMFILDEYGAIRENRQMVRNVDDRVDYVDDRVDDTEHRVDNMEDRLTDLERENAVLRDRLSQPIDVTAMVEWLAEMVAISAAQKLDTVEIQVEGKRVAALPAPVANLIIDVGSLDEREVVPVRREEDELKPLRYLDDGSDSSDEE